MCAQRILRGGPPPSISLLGPTTDAETNGFLLYPSLIGSYEAVGGPQRIHSAGGWVGVKPHPIQNGSSGCARAYTRSDASGGSE